MDNKLATKILLHFDFKTMEVLQEYITDKKQAIYKKMETADLDNFRKCQGELATLNQLENIRKHAEAVKETK